MYQHSHGFMYILLFIIATLTITRLIQGARKCRRTLIFGRRLRTPEIPSLEESFQQAHAQFRAWQADRIHQNIHSNEAQEILQRIFGILTLMDIKQPNDPEINARLAEFHPLLKDEPRLYRRKPGQP